MTGVPRLFSAQALAAVAVFAGIALAVTVWGAIYSVRMSNLRTEFETKQRSLDMLMRQTERKLHAKHEAGPPAGEAAAISAPTETVAASELQKAILTSLEKAGGTLHSIQADATSDVTGEGLRRLNAQTTFDGSIDALQKVLFDLETAVPFIFVDSLLVQPTAAMGSTTGEKLHVTLVTSSYWKGLDAGKDRH